MMEFNTIMECDDPDRLAHYYRALKENDDPPATEILLRLLASGDPTHVSRAARTLALKGDPSCLEKMKEIRARLPQRTGLADYRSAVDDAMSILAFRKEGKSCNCPMYEMATGFSSVCNPYREETDGFVSVDKTVVHEKEYYSEFFMTCRICGRRWIAEDDIGYHYPIYRWREDTGQNESRASSRET